MKSFREYFEEQDEEVCYYKIGDKTLKFEKDGKKWSGSDGKTYSRKEDIKAWLQKDYPGKKIIKLKEEEIEDYAESEKSNDSLDIRY